MVSNSRFSTRMILTRRKYDRFGILFFPLLIAIAFLVGAPSGFAPQKMLPTLTNERAAVDPVLPFILCSDATGLGGATNMHADSGRPRPVANVISSEKLNHMPGKRVTVAIVDFPPGAYSPPHRHGGTVNVYVLSGSVWSQLEGGPMELFPVGGTFFEPLGIIHVASQNASETEPARILAVFIHDEGATLTTYL